VKPLLLRAKYFGSVGTVRPEMVTGVLSPHPMRMDAACAAWCVLRTAQQMGGSEERNSPH
jgi:hypothetical protein